MTRLKLPGDYTEFWFDGQGKQLRQVASDRFGERRGLRFLEIGSYEGRSSVWLATKVLRRRGGTLVCVDPHGVKAVRERFERNTKSLRDAGVIEYRRETSRSYFSRVVTKPPQFDLVYVDGCHEPPNILEDAVQAFVVTKPGGMIVFDDYLLRQEREPHLRPKVAIDAFLNVFADKLVITNAGRQMVVRKKGQKAA